VWITVLIVVAVIAALFLGADARLNARARWRCRDRARHVFGTDPRLKLDIYRPANIGSAAPVVVFFYGGLGGGDKSFTDFSARHWRARYRRCHSRLPDLSAIVYRFRATRACSAVGEGQCRTFRR
jgi:hypothetical protein